MAQFLVAVLLCPTNKPIIQTGDKQTKQVWSGLLFNLLIPIERVGTCDSKVCALILSFLYLLLRTCK